MRNCQLNRIRRYLATRNGTTVPGGSSCLIKHTTCALKSETNITINPGEQFHRRNLVCMAQLDGAFKRKISTHKHVFVGDFDVWQTQQVAGGEDDA